MPRFLPSCYWEVQAQSKLGVAVTLEMDRDTCPTPTGGYLLDWVLEEQRKREILGLWTVGCAAIY